MKLNSLRLLLPDYATGRLSEHERYLVEDALKDSPELRAELEQIVALFDTFPAQRIVEEYDWRSRMLSVQVIERLRRESSHKRRWIHWLAFGTTCAAIAIAVVVMQHRQLTPSNDPQQLQLPRLGQSAQAMETVPVHRNEQHGRIATKAVVPNRAISNTTSPTLAEIASLDAVWVATFPYDEIDHQFVEQFAEMLSDATVQ